MEPTDSAPVIRLLRQEFEKGRTPIVELIEAQTRNPFKVLVATILSARTKDQTTAAACERLFRAVPDARTLGRTPVPTLASLIYPVGFYRTKARHLQALPAALDRLYKGVIPGTVEELVRLPGVGRKTANLVVAVAFDRPAICVDVHVHRISNRLGLVRTRTPLETEMALRSLLPRRQWKTFNTYLVSFGQSVCLPRFPRCEACVIARWCNRVGVGPHRPRKAGGPA